MTIDPRTRWGLRVTGVVLGFGLGMGCSADDGSGTPASGEDDDTGQPTMVETADDDASPTTSGVADSTGGDPVGTGVDEDSSTGEPIDPNLDRSAPNILDDPNLCGYPGPGPNGYGGIIDSNRFPNFVLEDCSGNQREFAEFFCRRDDDYEDFNRVFIVVFEAVW